MKKNIIVVILLVVLVLPMFAASSGINDMWDSDTDELDNKSQRAMKKQVRQAAGDTVKQINGLQKMGAILGQVLNKLYVKFNNIHNAAFGMNTTSSEDVLPTTQESLKFENRLDYRTGKVYKYLLCIFIVIECLIYAIKVVTSSNFQYSQIPGMVFNIIKVEILFYFLPLLPNLFTRFAFRAAEVVTNSTIGSMTFSRCMSGTTTFQNALAISGGTAFGASFFTLDLPFIELNGQPLSTLSTLCFGLAFAGLLLSFTVGLQFIVRCIDLFIANIAMCMVLPMAVFSGFGEDPSSSFKKYIRYYFVNMIEIFLGAVIILLSSQISQTVVEIADTSGLSLNMLTYSLLSVALPLIQAILMPATSKVLSSLLSGSVSDNNTDAMGGLKNLVGYTGIGMAGSALMNHKNTLSVGSKKKSSEDSSSTPSDTHSSNIEE